MRYSVILSPEEAQALSALVSQPLDLLEADGVMLVRLTSRDSVLYVEPEEVATPDYLHEHADVTRPKVTAETQYFEPNKHLKEVGRNLGVITGISILNTVIMFSDPENIGPVDIGEATIPEGTGYGFLFLDPKEFRLDPSSERAKDISRELADFAVVEADLGVRIETDKGHRVLIYTNGINYMVWANLDGEWPGDLEGVNDFLPLERRLKTLKQV